MIRKPISGGPWRDERVAIMTSAAVRNAETFLQFTFQIVLVFIPQNQRISADPCRKDTTAGAPGVSQSQSVLRQQGPKIGGLEGRAGSWWEFRHPKIYHPVVCLLYRTGSETLLICQWGISPYIALKNRP